jgi:Methyladenine glycosylase
MPMIDVYAAAGTFPDRHQLAQDLATAVMRWEQVPHVGLFRNNTAAFVHDMLAESIANVAGDSNYVRVHVLTPTGVLDREKQLGVVKELTDIVAAAAGAPGLAERTWVLLTEAPGGAGAWRDTRTPKLTSPAPRAQRCLRRARHWGRSLALPDQWALKGRMSDDVIIGHDGKLRCALARAGGTALGRYHDEVWGTRTYDEPALFEALPRVCPRPGSAGRSCSASGTDFAGDRRECARDEVSAAEARGVRPVLREHSQARAAVPGGPPHVDSAGREVRQAVEVAGLPLRGATSVYAFMQNVGVLNDHIHGCFRATDYTQPQTN